MRNPIPKRFRNPYPLMFVVWYFAAVGLHAMIDGRAPVPPSYALVGFAVGLSIAFWVQVVKKSERA